jgi:Putative glutamine amidotransferase
MFQFFFKYPIPVFTKGRFVLLGTWPGWLLLVLIIASSAGLALLIRSRLSTALPKLRTWRGGVLWLLQSLLIAVVLLLLWQPAITVAELSSQQNIIAILIDDSRSMALADSGSDGHATREAAAISAMQNGVLSGLQKRFQTRIYHLDNKLTRSTSLSDAQPTASATHLGDGLKQFAAETSDLPIGAVVLLTDGAENSGGIALDAINALGNRRLPVHTVGFGKEKLAHDVALEEVNAPTSAIAESRISATISFRQRGYAGGKATLLIRDGDKTLASREVTLAPDGTLQSETLLFDAGKAAARNIQFSVTPLAGEENLLNNAITHPVTVSDAKRRILYVEGEPRWEYKFIRRAEDDDHSVQIVSMLRTTENKIYRQGISNPNELADGFPSRPEDLFGYQAIILGSVEAGYFTPVQQELLREFVDRRGGGLLFLGGHFSLSDGGWGGSSDTELFPTFLPKGAGTFHRDPATAQLTPAGADSPITRLIDDPAKNVERWKKLTWMMDYQDAGSPKPGATVLAEMNAGHRKLPLLITQSYGHGRTAIMATGGTWRWQMSEALGDTAHDLFWQQLLRWLVADSPGQVVASVPAHVLMDEGHVHLTANVRDKQYMPATDAHVTASVIGPDGVASLVDMSPTPDDPGAFQADWTADKPGSYLTEITAQRNSDKGNEELSRDVVTFQRADGVAENFHTEQNRDLLEKLSEQTGGRYWKPDELTKLPEEISYSPAGISVRDTKELWNMPIVFLALLALIATEWLLRRKWGVV